MIQISLLIFCDSTTIKGVEVRQGEKVARRTSPSWTGPEKGCRA